MKKKDDKKPQGQPGMTLYVNKHGVVLTPTDLKGVKTK